MRNRIYWKPVILILTILVGLILLISLTKINSDNTISCVAGTHITSDGTCIEGEE